MRNNTAAQDLTEVRSIIRRILLKEDDKKDPKNPATWGLVRSYTKDGITYTFTSVTPGPRGSVVTVNYHKMDAERKSQGNVSIPYNMLPAEAKATGGAAPAPAAPAAAAPSAGETPVAAGKPAAKSASTSKPALETGYGKLNSVLEDLSTQMGTSISGNFSFGGKAYVASDIPRVTSADELSVSTVAYLYAVSGDLQKKIQGNEASLAQKFLSVLGADKNSSIANLYNDSNWTEMRNSLIGANPAPVRVAAQRYLESLPPKAPISDRTSVDGFADYLVILAKAVDVLPNDYGVKTAEISTGSAAGETLAGFLASINNGDDKIKADTEIKVTAKSAFEALIKKIGAGNVVAFEFAKPQIAAAIKILPDLKAKKDKSEILAAFNVTKIANYEFQKTEQGLIDLLKFTYVATRAGGEGKGFDAAAKMGVTRGTPDTTAFSDNPLYVLLGLAGSIEVAQVIAYTASANLEKGYTIELNIEGVRTRKSSKELTANTPNVLSIGTGVDEKIGTFSQSYSQEESALIAEQIVSTNSITATIKMPDGRSFTESDTFSGLGVVFKFDLGADAAAPPAEKAGGPRKSPITTTTDRLEGARTYEGTTDPFKLQNVYKSTQGVRSINSPNVALQKFAPKDFDTFTLRVNNTNRDFILVPIQLRSTLQEARWEISFLQSMAPPDTSDAGVGYIALSEITWTYDDNYIKYGLGEPKIQFDRINYIPSPESADIPGDVNIISIEEAKRRGVPGSESSDPIRNAIGEYIGSTTNPVGEALYMQPSLNVSMNSFSVRMYSNVRTNPR